MLKVSQVANRLNCSVSTVYTLIDTGQLGHHRCPGVRVSEEQLAAYLEGTCRQCGSVRKQIATGRSTGCDLLPNRTALAACPFQICRKLFFANAHAGTSMMPELPRINQRVHGADRAIKPICDLAHFEHSPAPSFRCALSRLPKDAS